MEENKNTSALRRRAQELRNAEAKQKQLEADKLQKDCDEHLKSMLANFEEDFAEVLPMLQEEGITYSAQVNSVPYFTIRGSYVEFKKDGHCLKMDYTTKGSYRYEYVPRDRTGSMTFGKWDMNRFITWINDELLEKYDPDPTPEQLARRCYDNYSQYFQIPAEVAAPLTEEYAHMNSFLSLAWKILVEKEWSGKVCCLHPVGDLEGAQPIGVVCANLPGYTRTGVIFKEEYSYTECCDILNEINEQLFGPEIVPLQDAIVGSSMRADDVISSEDDGNPQDLTAHDPFVEQAINHIHKWLEHTGSMATYKLDEGEMDDVARILLDKFSPHEVLNLSAQWIALAIQDVLAKRESKVN